MNFAEIVGGKAKNLIKLRIARFRVPKFVVLSHIKLKKSTDEELEQIIMENKFSDSLIVRSSANVEDSNKLSFAGQFLSLKTNRKNAVASIRKVELSRPSKNYYNKLTNNSVIIQEYIEGNLSGVIFSQHFQKGKSGILIEYAEGGAEQVVLGKKNKQSFMQEAKGKFKELYIVAKQIEKVMNSPQDIEFTIKNNKIYILQTRNITTTTNLDYNVWDSSNLAESYSGVISPLTISFAKYGYSSIYKDVALTSGISKKVVRKNEQVFNNLLGVFEGRMYYNLLNWYRMLQLFPSYERNKENLEDMLGLIKSTVPEQVMHSKSFKTKYYLWITVRYLLFERSVNKFTKRVNNYIKKTQKLDFSNLTNSELFKKYYELKHELLDKWSITVDNDFLLMTFFGRLSKQFPKQTVLELISNVGVASAKQVDALRELSETFMLNYSAIKPAKEGKYKLSLEKAMKDQDFNKEYAAYMLKYGGRFANELRLEAEDLDENPEYLIKLLINYTKKEPVKKVIPRKKSFLLKHTIKHLKHREQLRLLRSQMFGILRKLFNAIGNNLVNEQVIKQRKDIYYLEIDEVFSYINGNSIDNLQQLIEIRKKKYKSFKTVPDKFITQGSPYNNKITNAEKETTAIGCSKGIVTGRVKIMKKFELPNKQLDIVITKHTDPGWTPLFGMVKGIILENGGLLSHAAIVARELNLPCIIGAKGIMKKLKDGQIIMMDGSTGEIRIED